MNPSKFTVATLKTHLGDRTLYLYGAGPRGRTWASFFSHHGFPLAGFIDKSKLGKDIFSPVILEDPSFHKNAFVIITAQLVYAKQISALLQGHGLEQGRHFLTHSELCSYYPTIEVSGVCNLKCLSCNLGSPSANRAAGGFMKLDLYKKILNKLIQDIPFIPSVYLYLWGEPLLNPELPHIIEHTRDRGLGVEISTNLNSAENLERVIAADPAYLIIPCSGVGKNYEMTHTGGSWETFLKNLHLLRKLIDAHQAATGVEIIYHVYKHNLEADYTYIENLAKELGYNFKPVIANVFPERILDLVAHGEEIPENMKTISKTMVFSIDEQIAYSKKKNKNCVMMNAFPVIRWNGSVIPCCNMEGGTIADDYLSVPFNELKKRQRTSTLCKECITHKMQHAFYISGEIKTIDGMRTIIKT
jgi:MoaA/NifB/PqqE/SkfB family radical SAM enzyme